MTIAQAVTILRTHSREFSAQEPWHEEIKPFEPTLTVDVAPLAWATVDVVLGRDVGVP